MRRDSNDTKWAKVKFLVDKRDNKVCRLTKIITVQEMFTLKKNAGSRLKILDPAHVYPVSRKPEMCYAVDNIVTLNRFSHEMLDSYKHPITGKPISNSEVFRWWEAITGHIQWKAIKALVDGKKKIQSLSDKKKEDEQLQDKEKKR